MNTLSFEQIKAIKHYWNEIMKLNNQLYDIECEVESAFYNDTNGIEDERITKISELIQQMDEKYENMILDYGLSLYERDMDEELFAFINDGEVYEEEEEEEEEDESRYFEQECDDDY